MTGGGREQSYYVRHFDNIPRAALLAALLSLTPPPAAAQRPTEGTTATLGIGDRTVVVGYGSDGFVTVVIGAYTHTSHTVERERSLTRERYPADSVVAWVGAVRRWASPAGDTLRHLTAPLAVQAPVLADTRGFGPGRSLSVQLFNDAPVAGSIVLGGCDASESPTGVNASRADISRFLWTLERAALAARWAHASAPPGIEMPARDSVLEEHQVSCPARARATNTRPEFPAAAGISSYELLASFVVDSAGRPEPETLRTLPGSDRRFVASFEETLPIWRYVPGRRAGRRVRQRVHVVVPFRRWRPVAPSATAAVPVAPASDGSARVAIGPLRNDEWSGAATEAREYVFDVVRAATALAWADSVAPYLARDGRLPRGCYDLTCVFPLAEGRGAGLTITIDARREGGVKHHLGLQRCGGVWSPGYDISAEQARTLVTSVRAAARVAAARPHRASDTARPRNVHEVACPASELSKAKSSAQSWEFQGWKSGEMVVARFTVDTTGKVNPRSVRTLPGPSRAAVDSLGYLLRTVRFEPALFGGRKVPQFVHWALPIDVTSGDPQSPNPDLDMLGDAEYGFVGGPLRSADGNPVIGARVTLTRSVGPRDRLPLPYEATSNELGYYLIPAVRPGEYRLEVRAPGYPPLTPKLVTVNAEYGTQVELWLER